jgi:hypothetical protein
MIEMKNNKGKTIFGGFGIALLLCLLMVMMPFASTVSNGDTTEVEAVTTAMMPIWKCSECVNNFPRYSKMMKAD